MTVRNSLNILNLATFLKCYSGMFFGFSFLDYTDNSKQVLSLAGTKYHIIIVSI